ncbi:hypothetical protein HF086_001495 [Spodoptera exigua]|uniref:Lipase domain-containing protein n=1 Tax=Spodoptera exigua TaxID=7107 RepID=A0A922M3J1_SPOEX|nr:hypothetical protein HF086_001495 [Spodoptera exigua]
MARERAHAQITCLATALILAQAVLSQRHPIKEALLLHNDAFGNATFEDCVWRRDKEICPDPDVNLHLYTEADPVKNVVDLSSLDWLRQSGWDPAHENILLIHGYAGGDDTLPIVVLRDAYLRRGGYNVFMLDWGALCQPPCYVAAVHNLRPVARCVAEALATLRRAGLRTDNLTCVGHSLGAHLCGIIANYLTFRLNRIIGLDPARPLIRSAPALRLDPGDARAVHVLHTNAGRYGEGARLGHADFCLNGGRSQPYCEDTPSDASGAYCLEDFATPFCPYTSGLKEGDNRCCLDELYAAAATADPPQRKRPRPVRIRGPRYRHSDNDSEYYTIV